VLFAGQHRDQHGTFGDGGRGEGPQLSVRRNGRVERAPVGPSSGDQGSSTARPGSGGPSTRCRTASRSGSSGDGQRWTSTAQPRAASATRALNSAAPTLCTSSRPDGSMLVRCRVRSALTSRPSAWTMNRQGWLLCSDGASMARSTAALSASAAGVQPAARRRCSGRVVGHPDPRPRSRWLVPGPKSVVRGSSDPIGGETLTGSLDAVPGRVACAC
jgi:hypothetical protein